MISIRIVPNGQPAPTFKRRSPKNSRKSLNNNRLSPHYHPIRNPTDNLENFTSTTLPPPKKRSQNRSTHSGPAQGLAEIVGLLREAQGWPEIVAALQDRKSVTIDGAWGSAMALVVEGLASQAPGKLVVILPHEGDLDDFSSDWSGFAGNAPISQIAAWVKPPRPGETPEKRATRVCGRRGAGCDPPIRD